MNIIGFLGTRRLRLRLLPFVKWGFLLFGKSWNDFYRWMLNLQERNTTLDMILDRPDALGGAGRGRGLFAWRSGEYYVRFMRDHGLRPDHRVLDFGCGYGRAAIPLLKFSEPGNYLGTELSDKRIELARDWVAREGLEDRKPVFVVSTDNSMPYIEDRSIDIVWTYSVFTHMPEKEIHETLDAFKRVLKPDGVAYFHFNAPKPDAEGSKPTVKDFFWEYEKIDEIVRGHDFDFKRIRTWEDTLDEKIQQTSIMLQLRHRNP